MRIEMTADCKVAADGFTVETWAAGSVHEVTEQLGGDLVSAGKARAREETPAPEAPTVEAQKPKGRK